MKLKNAKIKKCENTDKIVGTLKTDKIEKFSAFSLIELLIAVTVSALVMTSVAFALSAGMRAYARVSSPATRAHTELDFLRALQSDLSSAVPLTPVPRFLATSKTLSFTLLTSPTGSAGDICPAQVEWRILPERGAVRTLTFLNTPDALPPDTRAFDISARNAFKYRGETPSVAESALWHDTWEFPTFPGQIKLGETVFTVWTSNFTLAPEKND